MKKEVKIFALGGLGEVGKNMYVVEYNNEIVVMDAGILFPDDNLLGIDYVIQDYAYLIENKERVVGVFITHGHEDHIGAIPFLLKQVNFPIYANGLSIGLIKNKLKEHRGLKIDLREFHEDDVIKFDEVSVEFFRTNHSIPDSFGIIIRTPIGIVVNTGDFKFDLTPVGPHANLQKMASIGSEGVLCLLSDSTNAILNGSTMSETVVADNIKEIFRNVTSRIIIATFASNVHRVQSIVEASVKNKRKIAVLGRSMEKVVDVGTKMGYIKAPKGTFIESKEINKTKPENLTIISTGSQGEQMAALSRIANNTHKQISLLHGDTVIFSSSPIPGNAESVGRTINSLFKNGANVIVHSPLNDTHTSGHAGADELKLMLNLIRPKYFMPVHGEHRMLKVHSDLAVSVGIEKENTFVLDNGSVLTINEEKAFSNSKVQAADVYIDGYGIGDIGTVVIGDRRKLSEDGLVTVALSFNKDLRKLVNKPTIISRGFIYMKDNTAITTSIQKASIAIVYKYLENNKVIDKSDLKQFLNNELSNHIFKITERSPIIMPVILFV